MGASYGKNDPAKGTEGWDEVKVRKQIAIPVPPVPPPRPPPPPMPTDIYPPILTREKSVYFFAGIDDDEEDEKAYDGGDEAAPRA